MKIQRSILFVISFMLVLAACNAPATGNSIATQVNPTPVTTQPTGGGACANQYFPSTPGATWTYANTSPQAPNSTTTRTITDINPTGFVVNDATTPDITVRVKWSCKDGNLTMLESARISATNIALAVSSAISTGFLIPATISVGNTWSEKLELVATGDVNGTQRMIQQNDTQIACTADGQESVQVQAGKFDALKVTCVYNITTTTQVDANPGKPVNSTITQTDWYVAGVGSVKTEQTGDIIDTNELTSYSIP
jgi:hypothetical protein